MHRQENTCKVCYGKIPGVSVCVDVFVCVNLISPLIVLCLNGYQRIFANNLSTAGDYVKRLSYPYVKRSVGIDEHSL